MTSPAPVLATKSQFAAIIGRDPAFVTRAVQSGKITGDALVGTGRSARIRIDAAKAQLGMALDLGQQLAQDKPLIFATAPVEATGPAVAADEETSKLHFERAEQVRLRNAKLRQDVERGEIEAAKASGELVSAAAVAAAVTRQMAAIVGILDEIPQALAKALSEQFAIPYAEVLIAVKSGVRAQRSAWAERVRSTAATYTPLDVAA